MVIPPSMFKSGNRTNIPSTYGTDERNLAVWNDRGLDDNYTTPIIYPHPKKGSALIAGLYTVTIIATAASKEY